MVSTAESAGPLRRVDTALGNVGLAETLAKAADAHPLKKRSAELPGLQRASFSRLIGHWVSKCFNGLSGEQQGFTLSSRNR